MSAFRRAFPKLHLALCRPVSVLVEATPNPKSMKFVLEGGEVLGRGTKTMLFRSPHEAIQSPLAKSLLELDGVREVLLAAEHVTVTKSTLAEWEDLQDVVEGEISKFYEAGHTVIEESAVESTDPQDFPEGSIEAEILELLEERVRPFVQQDGGDIEFVRFDHADSTLYLKMVGSCSGCSQSHATLQEGVKNLMDHYIPQVKQIVGLNDEMDWAL
ncbi:NIFU4 [Symbiodinium necroappetens]|uniref:NIFU4 protein n=1 Tax=Symbiodinium necroappetens TaxID=1628268 RepID=A0A813CI23_9DINO|nr:NIFU4 [Symbiodinium necroappetens]